MYKSVLLIFLLLLSSPLFAAQDSQGSISGIINYCDKGGVAGMQVFIPGKPHVVITGTDGRFSLTNIPVGDYSVNFMLQGKILGFNKWVEVSKNKNTPLELINMCDTDNVGKIATPDTPVILDKVNCGEIKEGTLFLINNGKGKCQDGKVVIKSCAKNYADCDKKMSNGCETNTNNDVEHCGSCFNICSTLDTCNLGMC